MATALTNNFDPNNNDYLSYDYATDRTVWFKSDKVYSTLNGAADYLVYTIPAEGNSVIITNIQCLGADKVVIIYIVDFGSREYTLRVCTVNVVTGALIAQSDLLTNTTAYRYIYQIPVLLTINELLNVVHIIHHNSYISVSSEVYETKYQTWDGLTLTDSGVSIPEGLGSYARYITATLDAVLFKSGRYYNLNTGALIGTYSSAWSYSVRPEQLEDTTNGVSFIAYALGSRLVIKAAKFTLTGITETTIINAPTLFSDQGNRAQSSGARILGDSSMLLLYVVEDVYLSTTDDLRYSTYSVDLSGGWGTYIYDGLYTFQDTPRDLAVKTLSMFINGSAISHSKYPNGLATDPVRIFIQYSGWITYHDHWVAPEPAAGIDVTINLTLPAITLEMVLDKYRPDRLVSIDLVLAPIVPVIDVGIYTYVGRRSTQLNHRLNSFIFRSEDARYIMRINETLIIPMINFTISKYSELTGTIVVESRISIPIYYYAAISELIGAVIDIYMSIGGLERLLSSTILRDISSPERSEFITLYTDSIVSTPVSGSIISVLDQFYERNQGGSKSVRIAPNNNLSFGDTLQYGEQLAQIKAAKVVTFIGQDQSFTEVTA